MINKNYIFILSSILIGFIISYFYIRNINKNFIILFLTISITLYIFFYFLGNDTIEKFEELINENNKESFVSTEEEDNEKNEPLPYHQILSNNKHIVSEEEHKQYNLALKEESNINKTQQPDNYSFYPRNQIDRPININISYTNENNIDNDEDTRNKHENKNNINKNEINKNNINKNPTTTDNNLGNYEDNSRIKLNSDWIYGESAWTNEPDFYVPSKNNINNIPQNINEKINTDKYRQSNRVSPVMINVPWTEYKSGDSEPEPYNLK